jgi:hypothetical protein
MVNAVRGGNAGLLASPTFIAFARSVVRSFHVALGRLHDLQQSLPPAQRQQQQRQQDKELVLRAAVMREYVYSLDLFNFGIALAILACGGSSHSHRRPALPPVFARHLLDYARRLTHYGADDYCGASAAQALAEASPHLVAV